MSQAGSTVENMPLKHFCLGRYENFPFSNHFSKKITLGMVLDFYSKFHKNKNWSIQVIELFWTLNYLQEVIISVFWVQQSVK